MKLKLVVESAPHGQPVTEYVFTGGRLVIGRSDDSDWVLHDPDMFVSRQHCILTEKDGQVLATDASSGGLFIDNAANPVGTGNAVPVEPGMRLRMGDVVLRIEGESPSPALPDSSSPASTGGMVFDFGRKPDEPPPPEPVERPRDLPDPFGLSSTARSHERRREPKPSKPLDQDDDFGLDLRRTSAPRATGGYFDVPVADPASETPDTSPGPDKKADLFAGWDDLPPAETPAPEPETNPEPLPREAAPTPPPPLSAAPPVAAAATERDAHDALLRGMGLDPAQFTGDPVQQAERIGQSMRVLVEGVMLLLRTRAQAKQKARVAQTIIASSNVNPLKFLASPEEALASLIEPRGRGYLEPDAALQEAFRDLTDHELRTWTALQAALRRMIDRFDPEAIERDMANVGFLENLIAGGRGTKLWRLYQERYHDIARSAEDQFLGEVGADFRDAYENKGRRQDD